MATISLSIERFPKVLMFFKRPCRKHKLNPSASAATPPQSKRSRGPRPLFSVPSTVLRLCVYAWVHCPAEKYGDPIVVRARESRVGGLLESTAKKSYDESYW